MSDVSIVMPAYKAQSTIVRSVQSALEQTHQDFELVISSDDQVDYHDLLKNAGIDDARIRQTSTGKIGTGSSNARNVGLAKAQGHIIVVLDADDCLAPTKLERCLPYAQQHGLVTTGLKVVSANGEFLRHVGCNHTSGLLDATAYKFVNISMDSMVLWDRRRAQLLYDVDQPCLVDLDLMLKAFCHFEAAYHLAEPLHLYFKQTVSISNGPDASDKFARIKKLLKKRLQGEHYPLVGGAEASKAFIRFLDISLEAEVTYPAAQLRQPDLLFEDHLEQLLN